MQETWIQSLGWEDPLEKGKAIHSSINMETNVPNMIWDKTVWGFPCSSIGKESACRCRRHRRHGFDPWVRKIPWRRKWEPTPVFLPGKSHGQRSLVGYRPLGHTESDMALESKPSPHQFSSVAQSCPPLCNPMDCGTPGFPIHHQLLKLAETQVHHLLLCHPPLLPSIFPSIRVFSKESVLHSKWSKYWS